MNSFYVKLDYLKRNSLIHGNVNGSKLTVILRRCQKIYIEPILGTPLHKDLLDKIASDTLNANEEELLDDYLLPALMIAVEMMTAEYQNTEIRNKNTGKANDEYTTANGDGENEIFTGQLKRDFNAYKSAMIGYLCDNEDNFPLYNVCTDNKEDIRSESDSDSFDDTTMFIY